MIIITIHKIYHERNAVQNESQIPKLEQHQYGFLSVDEHLLESVYYVWCKSYVFFSYNKRAFSSSSFWLRVDGDGSFVCAEI